MSLTEYILTSVEGKTLHKTTTKKSAVISYESEGGVTGREQPVGKQDRQTAAQVTPAGGFTSQLRCASLKGLYKPVDAFNETGWV